VLYVAVSLVAVGNLTIPELIGAKENALAIAAKPFLGQFGFLLISIGALFSIASGLNAVLYGGANISYALAKDGDLPEFFERKAWYRVKEGLYISAGLAVVFSVLFDMSGIASITTFVFTLIYIFVLISHYRLVDLVGGKRPIIIVNIVILSGVIVSLLYFQYRTQKTVLYGTLLTLAGASLLEFLLRVVKKRTFRLKHKV
jgi:amino acid transporter